MPDFLSLALSSLVSVATVVAGMKWLADKAISHKLERRLAEQQKDLDAELERLKSRLETQANEAQARLESALRRADEMILGEEAAERSYRFDAKKRLYESVGPLRFQLLTACSQYLSRIESIGKYNYDTGMSGYFGKSLLFRLGRLLSLTELIERQSAYADFSVDTGMIVLLRFRNELLRALSSGDVPIDHPAVDWDWQKEHLFRDTLSVIAVSLIHGEELRVIRFDEFEYTLGDGTGHYLEPLKGIVSGFDPSDTPIFWLRLLAIGQACEGLLENDPIASALDTPALPYRDLIGISKDKHLTDNAAQYESMLKTFRTAVSLPAARPEAVTGAAE